MRKKIYTLAAQLKHALGASAYSQALRSVYRALIPETLRTRIWARDFQRRYGDRSLYRVRIKGEDVVFSTQDEYSKHWFFPRYDEGMHEPGLTRLFARLADSSDETADVGANLGWFTCIAAAVSEGKVYSFEMDEDNVSRLCRNVTLNNQEDTVEIEQVAVADTIGDVEYWKTPRKASPVYGLTEERDRDSEQVSVSSTTLDEFFRGRAGSLDLLKIDVEGAELSVLNGGKEVLHHFQPDILGRTDKQKIQGRSIFFGQAASIGFFRLVLRHFNDFLRCDDAMS